MTEQEAMIRFDFIRCALLGGTKPEIIPNEDNVELMDIAINALEEVQQYRAIGTIEECREAVEKQKAEKPIGGKDIEGNEYAICIECSAILSDGEWFAQYCPDCGKKVDWREKEQG